MARTWFDAKARLESETILEWVCATGPYPEGDDTGGRYTGGVHLPYTGGCGVGSFAGEGGNVKMPHTTIKAAYPGKWGHHTTWRNEHQE